NMTDRLEIQDELFKLYKQIKSYLNVYLSGVSSYFDGFVSLVKKPLSDTCAEAIEKMEKFFQETPSIDTKVKLFCQKFSFKHYVFLESSPEASELLAKQVEALKILGLERYSVQNIIPLLPDYSNSFLSNLMSAQNMLKDEVELANILTNLMK